MAEALHIAWHERGLRRAAAGLVMGALATAAAIVLTYRSPNPTVAGPFAAAAIAGISIWMLTTARTHLALAILMMYLGLADGVIKLMTNSSSATLGRDLLLYAIVIGLLIKQLLRREPFVRPPLTGWIFAFVVVVAVQLFNPGGVSFKHGLASTRPHLEFVPLFFLGYAVMQSHKRLKQFLLILIVVAAANGLVGMVQFGMSPAQLASWGPGYAARIAGGNGISARGFVDTTGQRRVRPFGLGADQGFGGSVGLLAAPAVLALLSLPGDPRLRLAAGALSVGVVLAVVTSQARVAVIATVVAIVAYLGLVSSRRVVPSASRRRALRIVCGIASGVLIAYGAISVLAANTNSHLFDRYASITPSKVLSTAYSYRAGTIADVPNYAVAYPLGAGIGKTGPAGNTAGGTGNYALDAESEPTYLLIELGLPGLIVLTAFQLRFLGLSFKIRRLRDLELRLLLAAVAAPLFAIFASGFAGITTASTPGAPYFWFASGILTYWLIGARQNSGSHADAV